MRSNDSIDSGFHSLSIGSGPGPGPGPGSEYCEMVRYRATRRRARSKSRDRRAGGQNILYQQQQRSSLDTSPGIADYLRHYAVKSMLRSIALIWRIAQDTL